MPGIQKNVTGDGVPFGHNQFLHSTTYTPPDSRTIAKDSHPVEPGLDGNIKRLHPGEALAKITSGPDSGKHGVFQLGVTDGRQDIANLIGLNGDFWPHQLMDRDVETANYYECVAKQAWCTIRDATGARIALTNTVADALRGGKAVDILFK
jgi:hypothetical protein